VVTTAEEFEAALEKGGHIKFGADIESEEGFNIFVETLIDLAGYDLKVTGEGQATFWNYANAEVTDSVGGSTLYEQVITNAGVFKLSGSVKFDIFVVNIYVKPVMISGASALDLSGYTGEELYIHYPENVILPEGYACFDSHGNKIGYPSKGSLIFIRKDDTGTSAD
jgi:hypothetical protein